MVGVALFVGFGFQEAAVRKCGGCDGVDVGMGARVKGKGDVGVGCGGLSRHHQNGCCLNVPVVIGGNSGGPRKNGKFNIFHQIQILVLLKRLIKRCVL